MRTRLWLCIVSLMLCSIAGLTQTLRPGFDKTEYIDMLYILAHVTADSTYYSKFDGPSGYRLTYQSPVLGLDNLWQLWSDDRDKAVIAIRGSTQNGVSWLANFYAAMVPARGDIRLNGDKVFQYALTAHPHAAVHVGWMTAAGFLADDILPRIDSLYRSGIKSMIITGHSQGGAIAYLLTAHLYALQRQNVLPADIRFKTYSSAAPKPGNLYFAYAYEAMTQGGWSCNVVNAADWVPETPLSIQTFEDFNTTNPFLHARTIIKRQKFPKDLAFSYVYGRLNKPLVKARKRYRHYLGDVAGKMVTGNFPGYAPPPYYNSNHYVRTGTTIVLFPDDAYYQVFPEEESAVFRHHFIEPYLFLAERLEEN